MNILRYPVLDRPAVDTSVVRIPILGVSPWEDLFETAKVQVDLGSDPVWDEIPVSFKEFCESPLYAGSDSPSEEAYFEVDRIIGTRPDKIFSPERKIREAIWLIGKGGGKGFVTTLLFCYMWYVVHCLRSPHKFFGVAKEDPLDFVTVALSASQSNRLFDRIVKRIQVNRWFQTHYNLILSGKVLGAHVPGRPSIEMSGSYMRSPSKNMRALSLHSQNESWEGLTILFAILDEFSGFKSESKQLNADAIYNTVTTSTRELPYIVIITSYQRLDEDHDATVRKYKVAMATPESMVACRYYTWQFKPRRFFPEGTFDFVLDKKSGQTEKVPLSLKKKFELNPEDCKAKYMCIGAAAEDRFVEYPEMINECTLVTPMVKTSDYRLEKPGKPGSYYLCKRLEPITERIKTGRKYVITIDGSESYADTSLSMGYSEVTAIKNAQGTETNVQIIVVGVMLVWRPDPNANLSVDLDNVMEITISLAALVGNNVKVRLDHWNSALMERQLLGRGIQAERMNASIAGYNKMKAKTYSGTLWLPDCPETQMFAKEFKALGKPKTGKPRVIYGKQDIVDTVAQLCDMLYDDALSEEGAVVGISLGNIMTRRTMIQSQQEGIEKMLSLKTMGKEDYPIQAGLATAIGVSVYGGGPNMDRLQRMRRGQDR